MTKCPQCNNVQYFVCGNGFCSCWKSIPPGAMPQRHIGDDLLECPYCGFSAHIDYWFNLDLEEAWKSEPLWTRAAHQFKLMLIRLRRAVEVNHAIR